MTLPIAAIDACILNWITTVNHHSITHIDSYMAGTTCIVGALEEYQIPWLGIILGYSGALIQKSVCCLPSHIPAITTMVNDIAYKAGTVKACAWATASPYIRIYR